MTHTNNTGSSSTGSHSNWKAVVPLDALEGAARHVHDAACRPSDHAHQTFTDSFEEAGGALLLRPWKVTWHHRRSEFNLRSESRDRDERKRMFSIKTRNKIYIYTKFLWKSFWNAWDHFVFLLEHLQNLTSVVESEKLLPSTGLVTMPVNPPTTPCREIIGYCVSSANELLPDDDITSEQTRYLQQSFSSFSQTRSEVFGRSVHLLSPFLLILFIHRDGGQTFTHRTRDPGHHTCSSPCRTWGDSQLMTGRAVTWSHRFIICD